MKNSIIVDILSPQEFIHSSYIITGLNELAAEHSIQLNVKVSFKKKNGVVSVKDQYPINTSHQFKKTSYCQITDNGTGKKVKVAFDMDDIPYHFSKHALDTCDVIFKRNYIPEYVSRLSDEDQQKILPLGMPFAIRPDKIKGKFKMLWSGWIAAVNALIKPNDLSGLKRIPSELRLVTKNWGSFVSSRRYSLFEKYSPGTSAKVFYLKRFFADESDSDTLEVHDQRGELVRLLRSNLGDSFIGGLQLNPIVSERFPDCVSNMPSDPHQFLEEMRGPSIAVYTRGLKNSVGWTLPEFFSQGKCIVAEKQNTLFPFPPEHGINILYFDTNEECLTICKELLLDSNNASNVGKSARKYYDHYINPKIVVQNMIKTCLER